MKKPNPQELWRVYREMVYEDGMPPDQERDMSMAFYAGIECAYRVIDKIMEQDYVSEKVMVELLLEFREKNEALAQLANLDRATGKS